MTPFNLFGRKPTSSQLEGLSSNNYGLQASADGSQNGMQSVLFNPPTVGSNGQMTKGGFNFGNLGSIMQGVGSIANIYSALKSIGIAEDQLDFQKEAYSTNLENQEQSYNTSLEDRTRARAHTEGRPTSDVDAYLAKHKL